MSEENYICSSCKEKIEGGEFVNLETKFFHIEHFTCKTCGVKLGGKTYYEIDDNFLCEEDYMNTFGIKCAHCSKTIKDQYISILGKDYHNECFVCSSCKKPFKDDQYFNFDGNPVCPECSASKAHQCKGCNKPILDKLYSALNNYWHFDCFKCEECHKTFAVEGFISVNDKAYHQSCFKLMCIVCNQPCSGEYYQVDNNQAVHEQCIETYKKNREQIKKAVDEAQKKLDVDEKKDVPKPAVQEKPPAAEVKSPIKEVEKKPVQVQAPPPQKDPILVKPKMDNIEEGMKSMKIEDNKNVFPYKSLINLPYPEGVDASKREEYLSDSEFMTIFKMDKEAFKNIPAWKKTQLKKTNKLF